jgi:hypothetical protein
MGIINNEKSFEQDDDEFYEKSNMYNIFESEIKIKRNPGPTDPLYLQAK